MKRKWKRITAAVLSLLTVFALLPRLSAAAREEGDITESTAFSGTGYDSLAFLHDGNTGNYRTSDGGAVITLENDGGMGGLYLLFDLEYGSYTITDNGSGAVFTAGEKGFLHEYIDLLAAFGAAPTSVTLTFGRGDVRISEAYVLPPGQYQALSSSGIPLWMGKRISYCLPPMGMTTSSFSPDFCPCTPGNWDTPCRRCTSPTTAT